MLPATLALVVGLGLAGCKSSEEKAAEYFQSGLDLLAQGDVDRAIVQFRNVFSIEGTHYEARKTLAEVLAEKGDTRTAYSQYLRLAEQYPDDLQTRITLARMAFEASDAAEFERHAARATELSPDDPEVKALELALRYQKVSLEEDDTARRQIAQEARTLTEARPDDVLLLSMLLDAAWQDQDMAAIEPLVERLLTLQPDNRVRYQQRLGLLVDKGDMAQVEQHLLATIEQFPDDPQTRSDLVSFYISQNQHDKAEAYLRQLAEAAPADTPEPWIDLIRFVEYRHGQEAARAETGKALQAGGDPLVFRTLGAGFDFSIGKRAEAIADLRDLLAGAEASDQTRNISAQLARMLMQDGQEEAARQQVAEILKENPSHPAALKLKAGWEISADRTEDAILMLRTVLDQLPEDVEALGLMASAYRRTGEPDLARDYLAQAAKASGNAPGPSLRLATMLVEEGRWRPAEDAVLPALKLDPQNVALLSMLGRIYLGMPDLPRAKGVITQLRQIGSPPALAEADSLELAQIAAEKGEDAAMSYLEEMARDDEAGLGARLGLIRARLTSGQIEEARTLAAELVADHPEDRGVRLLLAMTEAAAGDVETAREALEKLIDEEPQDPRPYLAILALLDGQGDPESVSALLDRGLAEIPDQPDLLWAKAGLVERSGDIEAAIAIYDRLYAENSESVIIANNLASLLATWHADDPKKVARASAVARRLKDTQVPAFMDTYGWIQHLNGDSEAALPYLETAARVLSDDMAVQIHLGLVLESLGRTEAAKAQLTRALALADAEQDSSVVRSARAALNRIETPAAAPAAQDGQSSNSAEEISN